MTNVVMAPATLQMELDHMHSPQISQGLNSNELGSDNHTPTKASCMVLCSCDDRLCTAQRCQEMAGPVSEAGLAVTEVAGHQSVQEQLKAANRILQRWKDEK